MFLILSTLKTIWFWPPVHVAIFGYLASIDDKDVQRHAKEMFKHHIDGSKPICASLRDAVFKAVMVTANRQTFNQLKNLYRNAELAEEKNRILHAFGFCQDPNIISLGKRPNWRSIVLQL